MNTPIMTLEEVAVFLHVHVSTVRTIIRDQGLPHFKIGTDYRFHRDAVMLWIGQREKQAQSEQAAQFAREKRLRAFTLVKGSKRETPR